jgi:hypothetical protein
LNCIRSVALSSERIISLHRAELSFVIIRAKLAKSSITKVDREVELDQCAEVIVGLRLYKMVVLFDRIA